MYGAGLENNVEIRKLIRVSQIEGSMLRFSLKNSVFSFDEIASLENYNSLIFYNNSPNPEEIRSCFDSLIEESFFREIDKDKYSADWKKNRLVL